MSAALDLSGVRVVLGGREVLTGVDLSVPAGSLTVVCGPNGAGKTTLLRAALGLAPLSAGTRSLFGREPSRLKPAERAALAGYLPQEKRIAWGLSALDVAALGAITQPLAVARARALGALKTVGLSDLADRSVFEMSGGERGRVLLARLIATAAPLLVLDEPVAGLDPEAQLVTLELLQAQVRQGATVVVTLHDLSLAARFADRVVVLHQGRVAAEGPPMDALAPAVLKQVFGLNGVWVETAYGVALSAGRVTETEDS
jgi:iron complex transport system ATP-binding protein